MQNCTRTVALADLKRVVWDRGGTRGYGICGAASQALRTHKRMAIW